MQMKTYRKHIGILMLVFAAVACVERHPQLFGDIAGVYFNNRTSGVFSDERNVTFVYEDEDEVQILSRYSWSEDLLLKTGKSALRQFLTMPRKELTTGFRKGPFFLPELLHSNT